MKNTPLVFTALSLAAVAPFQSSFADDIFWSGGTDANWATDTNWGGTAPTSSDFAVFNATTAYTNQPSLDAFTTQSINGLKLGGASAVVLTIGANTGTQNTSGATSNGSSTITLADVSTLTVGQQVSGSRIQAGTFITAVDTGTNTITLSRPTSGGTLNTATALTFTSALQIGAGGITVDAGTTQVQTISAPIVLGSSQAWTNNSTTANALTLTGTIQLGSSTLTFNGVTGSTTNISPASGASVTGTGGWIIDTDGTLSINGRAGNTFTGGVVLNKGKLVLNGGSSGGTGPAGGLGTGVLTINGGSIAGAGNIAGHALTISGQIWNADVNYVGNKNIDFGAGGISLGTTAGTSRTISVEQTGGGPTFGGVISDGITANSIIKVGVGTMTLEGASTYTGSTTINVGTLKIGEGDNRLPTGTILIVNGGATTAAAGTFNLNGRNQTVAGLSGGSGAVQGVVTNTLAASTSTITVTGTSTFDGVIQDGGIDALTALTKSNAGTLTLAGANTYTGVTTISGGTLALGAANRIADTSNLILAGGTFATRGFSETLGALEVSASSIIDLGSGASALVFADSSAITWGGSVSLSIINFTEGVDSILFGASASSLTLDQLSKITINGGAAGIDSQGYLTASMIPEPSSYALLAGFGTLALAALRRRRR